MALLHYAAPWRAGGSEAASGWVLGHRKQQLLPARCSSTDSVLSWWWGSRRWRMVTLTGPLGQSIGQQHDAMLGARCLWRHLTLAIQADGVRRAPHVRDKQ